MTVECGFPALGDRWGQMPTDGETPIFQAPQQSGFFRLQIPDTRHSDAHTSPIGNRHA